nr:MAG TPA: hypothetical protein [Inoviridae sp.]
MCFLPGKYLVVKVRLRFHKLADKIKIGIITLSICVGAFRFPS